MKKIFLISAFITIFSACAKDKQATELSVVAPEKFLGYIQSKITENPDATISVISDPVSRDFPTPKIWVTAGLNSNLGDGTAIQEVYLGHSQLSRVVDSINDKVYYTSNSDVNNPFGQTVPVNFKTRFFDLQTNFHLPELVKLKLGSEIISKSKDYTFNWNKDANNDLPVQISFMYDEVASRYLSKNTNFPKENLQITKFVQDEGQCTLSSAELTQFPLGSIVRVSIKRGPFLYQKSNNKNILLYALSSDSVPVLTVVD